MRDRQLERAFHLRRDECVEDLRPFGIAPIYRRASVRRRSSQEPRTLRRHVVAITAPLHGLRPPRPDEPELPSLVKAESRCCPGHRAEHPSRRPASSPPEGGGAIRQMTDGVVSRKCSGDESRYKWLGREHSKLPSREVRRTSLLNKRGIAALQITRASARVIYAAVKNGKRLTRRSGYR